MTRGRTVARWVLALGATVGLIGGCTGGVDDPGATANGDCPKGQAMCSGACVDVLANPASCGSCSRACGPDQICNQGACKSKAEGCGNALRLCGGGCVDPASNSNHCGDCDKACPSGQSCSAGACVCSGGNAACGAVCADLRTDAANCGSCATVCSGGRTCQQGSCQCTPGTSYCGSTCADVRTDAANCGACGVPCSGGKQCVAGSCTCPSGKLACGVGCADTSTDPLNCGTCGVPCSLGQSCVEGHCLGGGSGPDGCSGLAQGITLAQIAVYQTVSIPIMKAGAEVSVSARNTDVVAGRDTVFRAFVTPASGFAARQLSARVFVQNGASIDSYFGKANIAGPSQEATLTTTFQVAVPKDKITRDTRYALELVECGGAASGGAASPRFPEKDGVALGARQTGVVKLKLIPLRANSMSPDTSETALATYRALMLAMYPITGVEFSVGDSLTVADASDWTAMLDQVRAKRQADKPAADVYYYGLLKPAATLREYCGNGCTAGIGYVPQGSTSQQASQRAALGLAFADAASAETMAHEVGHNHGRDHASCPQTGISGVDPSYPYANGAVGVYGWDARSQALVPPSNTDIMGYCNKKWISDYTYDGLVNRVALVNGAPQSELLLGDVGTFRVLLLDARGPRWGLSIDEPSLPAGKPEPAEVLDALGNVIRHIIVYRTPISDVGAFSIQVPTPGKAWARLRVSGAADVAFVP